MSEDTEQYNNVLIMQGDSLSFACFERLLSSVSPCQSIHYIGNHSSLSLSQHWHADLCASPSSPSCRCPSAEWSWPMLCPSWQSEVAARLLSPSPPPVQLLALHTEMERRSSMCRVSGADGQILASVHGNSISLLRIDGVRQCFVGYTDEKIR